MHAERTRVLELVKSGVLTIEQADDLIDALQTANPPQNNSMRFEPINAPQPPRMNFAPIAPPQPPRPPRAPRASGGGKFSFEQMIELGKFGINAQYVRELADSGLTNLSFDDIIEFGKFGIRADYVIELRKLAEELEMDELDSEKIIELGKFGVRPENVREMLSSGLFDLSQSQTVMSHEKIQAKRDQLQAKLDKVQAKRDKVLARLEAASTEHEQTRFALAHHETEIELQNLNEQMDLLVEQEMNYEA
jgi:hypothetical protein